MDRIPQGIALDTSQTQKRTFEFSQVEVCENAYCQPEGMRKILNRRIFYIAKGILQPPYGGGRRNAISNSQRNAFRSLLQSSCTCGSKSCTWRLASRVSRWPFFSVSGASLNSMEAIYSLSARWKSKNRVELSFLPYLFYLMKPEWYVQATRCN